MFKNRYRIVRDKYLGYEAQVRLWWWPFTWHQMGRTGNIGCNTHFSVEGAEKFIKSRGVVKEVFL